MSTGWGALWSSCLHGLKNVSVTYISAPWWSCWRQHAGFWIKFSGGGRGHQGLRFYFSVYLVSGFLDTRGSECSGAADVRCREPVEDSPGRFSSRSDSRMEEPPGLQGIAGPSLSIHSSHKQKKDFILYYFAFSLL